MSLSKFGTVLVASTLAACSSSDYSSSNNVAEQDHNSHEKYEAYLYSELDNIRANIDKNKEDEWYVEEQYYDAFKISFQLGDFTNAEKYFSMIEEDQYDFQPWDLAARSEIFARNGDFDKAKEFIDIAINSYSTAGCSTNPQWLSFQSNLESKSYKAVITSLSNNSRPILVQTAPEISASSRLSRSVYRIYRGEHYKKNGVHFRSLPKELPITVVIDAEGNIACISVQEHNSLYTEMLKGLMGTKFKAASIASKPVWQYGLPHIIQTKKRRVFRNTNGHISLQRVAYKEPVIIRSGK